MHSTVSSPKAEAVGYDPFARGRFHVGVRTVEALDATRDRVFPCEIWSPESAEGNHPLVAYSHHSGGNRRAASYLCDHLASHGYVVAALDHSEVIAEELHRKDGETAEQLSTRAEAWIANRVPDMRFLLDHMLRGAEARVDPDRVGIVGHSFGGWTALATPEVDSRIRAVVALAPAGSSNPQPGVIPAKLSFRWGRDIPTVFLVAENDVPLPLDGMYDIFERTPSAKQMVILRRADHYHFLDNAEQIHETVRNMTFPPYLTWMTEQMRPISELCSGSHAESFVRALTLSHMDAILKQQEDARRFLAGDIEAELASRGVDVLVHKQTA
jgi:predicted dienelactone hydrolase